MGLHTMVARLFGRPDRRTFARLVVAALHDEGVDGSVEISDEVFRLVLDNGDGQFALGQLYEEFSQAAPWNRAQLLRRFARTAHRGHDELPQDYADARGQLMPVVRDAFLYEALELEMTADGTGPLTIPTRSVTQRLCTGLVYDWPDSMCSIDQACLDRWGVTFDEAYEDACDNLDTRTTTPLQPIADGLYLSNWQDNYDTARLLLPTVYRDCAIRGDVLAFVPNRDCLLITGSEDPQAIEQAAAIVEEQLDAPRPISAIPLIGQHLQWSAFNVPDGHPCATTLHRQAAMEWAACYEQQEKLLEAALARDGQQFHIARYQAIHDPDNDRIFSYSVWDRGVPTLLPRTDEVVLVETKEHHCDIIARLRWEDLAARCPEMQNNVARSAPRYRVCDFPNDEAYLKERCLELA